MPDRPICDICNGSFKTRSSLSAHRRRVHKVYKRQTKHAPKAAAELAAPPLGASVKVMELALDPDENIVVVLSNGTARWRAVIFEAVK